LLCRRLRQSKQSPRTSQKARRRSELHRLLQQFAT
jgi:hypothetical protein